MVMKTLSKAYLLSIISLILITLYSSNASSDGDAATTGQATGASADSAADRDWAELTSSGPRPKRHSDESELAYFMRQVEISDARRRELGLKFWENYQDDPRRYQWLILTVHMPPHYAKDINEWAKNETMLRPNPASIDTQALAAWQDAYPAMREAFWASPHVTEQQRRFLWFGELEQKILRAQESYARGEMPESQPILNGIVDFIKAYPARFSELDSKEHYWNFERLINAAIYEAPYALGLDQESIKQFALTLSQPDSMPALILRGNVFLHLLSDLESLSNQTIIKYEDNNQKSWGDLPAYPNDQGETEEVDIVFFHDWLIRGHKYRDIGLRLWQEDPDHSQRYSWLIRTLSRPAAYPTHFVNAMRTLAGDANASYDVDEAAQAKWDRTYARLRTEFWNDPETTDGERASIRAQEVSTAIGRAGIQWRKTQNAAAKARVLQSLDGIYELYTEYDYDDTSSYVRGYSAYVLREAAKLGLSDKELLEFFEPMLDYDHKELRTLAQAASTRIQLRTNPLEFAAPTMDGKDFKISDFRGKIVLVDYWATTCAACIAAMPDIHKIYERYKDRGFEVVSVCFDGDKQRKKVLRAEKEMGLAWTTLAADAVWEELNARYGFGNTVPQYMLLNRDGTLYADTSEVNMGRNLEALLKEMLAAEAE